MTPNVALIDDDEKIIDYIHSVFEDEPFNLFILKNPRKAFEQMVSHDFAVVIVNPLMFGDTIVNIVDEIKKRQPETEVIFLTQLYNYQEAKKMVEKVILNPWDIPSIKKIIDEAVAKYESKKEVKDNTSVKRILYIDDDPYINDVIQDILKIIGYESEVYQNSMSALELIESQPDSFDLILTDMNMPHMNGIELSKELQHTCPDLPIILCTGHGERITKELVSDVGVKYVLSKPFTMKQLETAVHEVLD